MAARVIPVTEMDLGAVVVTVPFPTPQAFEIVAVATVRPLGTRSVKEIPLKEVAVLGFTMRNLRLEVPPREMGEVIKVFVSVGGVVGRGQPVMVTLSR